MIDQELARNKMSDIEGYLKELEPLLQEDSRVIIENNLKLRTVERLFQLIVDTTIDINTHLIAESGFPIPDDYQNTFMVLAKHNVIPVDFALIIAPSVGLRNLVVHKYGRADIKKMIDDIKEGIDQYRAYLTYIAEFLKSIR